ncbi:MAG: metalloregulator ArsR/SmtB family transcription factor [Anaerolineaceae bacterium]
MEKQVFTTEELTELSGWLKVIYEPNRLMLLEKIVEGVQCNCELGNSLQIPPNLISHHLSVLREAGLVETKRDAMDGRWIYYSINPKVMNKLKLLFNNFFDPDRIQPRQLLCGPLAALDQKEGAVK